jgi:methylthioribose-1-phosphate isomerase
MPERNEEIEYLEGWNVPLTIWWDKDRKIVKLIDQTLLPDEVKVVECKSWMDIREAIKVLRIRGAPALGAAGAYALAVEAQRFEGSEEGFFRKINEASEIASTRPTAVNLNWGVERIYKKLQEKKGSEIDELKKSALNEARKIVREDIEANIMIGKHGLVTFGNISPRDGSTFKILTHCNAGSLATCGYGTALGVIRGAVENRIPVHVFVDETRPLLQGGRITTWELQKEGIPVTLNTDSMAGWIMHEEKIDMVIVGADRIAANGDTANKIGTYSLSILAKEHGIPFYVAAPTSTIDKNTKDGSVIKIEERDPWEVTHVKCLRVAPHLRDGQVRNYAFDVTPHKNIAGIITEKKIIRDPYDRSIERLNLTSAPD